MLILKPIGERVAGYYLGQGTGEWIGRGSDRLGLDGDVGAAALGAVLRGCDPKTGDYLPRLRSSRRRAGWDLVFAAPKSLSLLSAHHEEQRSAITTAHRKAVSGTLDHLQRDTGKDIVAASFGHVTNAGGEPHLHTHVLVANLVPGPDGWSALGAWLARDELAAIYHLGLRRHLELGDFSPDWRIRPGGLPDLAVVPRAAVRATSTRAQESRLGAGWAGRRGPGRDWAGAAINAGWSRDQAARVTGFQGAATPAAGSLESQVASRLLTRGSTFNRRDVVVALAATAPAGFDSEEATSWAVGFCDAATPVGSSIGVARWTTPLAIDADRRLAELVSRRVGRDGCVPSGDSDRAPAVRADSTLSPESVAAARRLAGEESVIVLAANPGCSNFVSNAAVASACASVWEAQGKRVAVATRAALDATRWKALSGIEAFRPSRRPDVLLVDQSDRRPPGELMALLSAAPQAKVVFVEGGTLPRARVDSSLGYGKATSDVARLDPGPAPAWRALGHDADVSLSTGLAVGRLLTGWAEGLGVPGAESPIMVGLGVPEIVSLNEAARRHLAEAGLLNGPCLSAYGRSFQAGDRVVAIRGAGAGLSSGTVGTVLEVDPKKQSVLITWPDRATHMKRQLLGAIGHAYAATPRLASRMEGPVLVLGHAQGLGLERSRVAAEVSFEPRAPALGMSRRHVDAASRDVC